MEAQADGRDNKPHFAAWDHSDANPESVPVAQLQGTQPAPDQLADDGKHADPDDETDKAWLIKGMEVDLGTQEYKEERCKEFHDRMSILLKAIMLTVVGKGKARKEGSDDGSHSDVYRSQR